MNKKHIYGILACMIISLSVITSMAVMSPELQISETEKNNWANQNKDAQNTHSQEELEAMRQNVLKDKNALDEEFAKKEIENDKIDSETEKILKKIYKKDIKILTSNKSEKLDAVKKIVEILNQKNDLSENEIAILKKSLSRRCETVGDYDTDLKQQIIDIIYKKSNLTDEIDTTHERSYNYNSPFRKSLDK